MQQIEGDKLKRIFGEVKTKTVVRLSFLVLLILVIMSVIIAASTIYLAFTKEMTAVDLTSLLTAWSAIVVADITECGTVTGFYIWKAKKEQGKQYLKETLKATLEAIPEEQRASLDLTQVITTIINN